MDITSFPTTWPSAEVANASADTITSIVDNSGNPTVWNLAFGTGEYLTDDTVTFTVDSVFYSGKVTANASGDITEITLHGASAATKSGTSDTTSIASPNAATGAITFAWVSNNNFRLTGTVTGTSTFTTGLATTDNSGTNPTKGSVARGITAGAMYADISTTAGANSALKTIDQIITDVNTARSSSGAVINRLEYAADNLANVSQNTSASRSRILDADYAAETTELARTQIIQQAGTAMLSQANQAAQSVLALLR